MALLVLDMAAVEEWAKAEGVLPMDERVQQMIGNEVFNLCVYCCFQPTADTPY